MQGVLACIDANGVSDCSGCLMGHGDVLLVLLSSWSSSERFGAGARPVYHSRHFAAAQQFGRIWSEADIKSQSRIYEYTP